MIQKRTKIFAPHRAVLLAAMFIAGAVALPSSIAFESAVKQPPQAACSGNPCVDTKCYTTEASAHAYSSDYAWANAWTATTDDHDQGADRPVHARAVGAPTTSAQATAKVDWSFEERHSHCANGGGTAAFGLFGVGCVADDRVAQGWSFAGSVAISAEGDIVAFDATRGRGLPLGPEFVADGATLGAVTAFEATELLVTQERIAMEFVRDDARTSCAIHVT